VITLANCRDLTVGSLGIFHQFGADNLLLGPIIMAARFRYAVVSRDKRDYIDLLKPFGWSRYPPDATAGACEKRDSPIFPTSASDRK